MANRVNHNRPGAPVNTPQHLVGEEPDLTGASSANAPAEKPRQQGGAGSAASAEQDAADPHPSDEGNPYDAAHPGGANPPAKDIGPNPARHDGSAPPRPHNAGSGPE